MKAEPALTFRARLARPRSRTATIVASSLLWVRDMALVGLAPLLLLGVIFGEAAPVAPRAAGSLGSSAWTYTTGDARLDARLCLEAAALARLFGVMPNLVLFDDGANPNAYASEHVTGPGGDGTVAVGLVLLAREMGH